LAKVSAKETGTFSVFIIGGNFDLEKIRGYLDDAGLKQDTYRGEEIWHKENEGYTLGIALFKDKLIIGDARRIIQVMKGEEKSLYDIKDAVDVVNKLPDGFTITIYTYTEGGDVRGDSHVKMSEEEIKIQTIYKFDDERTAEDATKGMEQYYKEYYEGREVDVEIATQDEYVIYSLVLNISDYF